MTIRPLFNRLEAYAAPTKRPGREGVVKSKLTHGLKTLSIRKWSHN